MCWVPKYRRLDCGEDEEELLTVSGPLVRRADRRAYCLAVVQRLYSRGGVVEARGVELRVLAEQDTWGYQDLAALPGGEGRGGELFRRCLASVAPDVLSGAGLGGEGEDQLGISVVPAEEEVGSGRAVTLTPAPPDDIPEETFWGVSIDYPHVDGEDDPDMVRRILVLERKVMAKQARKPEPLVPAGPVRHDIHPSPTERHLPSRPRQDKTELN